MTTPDDQPQPAGPWAGTSSTGTPTGPGGTPRDDTAVRPEPRPAPSRDDDSLVSFLKELPILLLIAFGLAFLLRTFVVQVFYIPSESMVPTLQVDDRIVVEKISYLFGGPERGDVVVFAGEEGFPASQQTGVQRVVRGVGQFLGVVPVDARDLVKRVIGLPGDTVTIEDGVVSVNGTALDEPYAMLDEANGEYTVPEGQLFVMGDNRGNSADSRSSLGPIDVDDVVGRAVVTIWPFDRFGRIREGTYEGVPTATEALTGSRADTVTATDPWALPLAG